MSNIFFLPGASGRRDYWRPVAEYLTPTGEAQFIGWPGFGGEPRDPEVSSLSDLVCYVERRIDGPVDLVAQSMGGVVAVLLALKRPDIGPELRRYLAAREQGG